MAVEVCPALADHLVGLVDVVQALKSKLGVFNYSGQSPSVVCVPNYKPTCVHIV